MRLLKPIIAGATLIMAVTPAFGQTVQYESRSTTVQTTYQAAPNARDYGAPVAYQGPMAAPAPNQGEPTVWPPWRPTMSDSDSDSFCSGPWGHHYGCGAGFHTFPSGLSN